MPGKPDYGIEGGPKGQFFPGSKEYRAWDEGWRRRYADGALSKPNTVHPVGTAEYVADQSGWTDADNNSTGKRRMPFVSGVPA